MSQSRSFVAFSQSSNGYACDVGLVEKSDDGERNSQQKGGVRKKAMRGSLGEVRLFVQESCAL